MNTFFSCQTKTIEVYHDIARQLSNRHKIEKVGYFVSGQDFYTQVFLPKNRNFEEKNRVIKEWDCVEKGRQISTPDLDYLQSFDGIEKNMPLFAACMGDRRIYQGKKATFSQDYAPSYSYREMLGILQVSLLELEKAFLDIRPDFTGSLYPATYSDLLTYILSKKHGIPHFDLRLSRMKNYVMFGDGILEPNEQIKSKYQKFLTLGEACPQFREALDYLNSARREPIVYEGAVKGTIIK